MGFIVVVEKNHSPQLSPYLIIFFRQFYAYHSLAQGVPPAFFLSVLFLTSYKLSFLASKWMEGVNKSMSYNLPK